MRATQTEAYRRWKQIRDLLLMDDLERSDATLKAIEGWFRANPSTTLVGHACIVRWLRANATRIQAYYDWELRNARQRSAR